MPRKKPYSEKQKKLQLKEKRKKKQNSENDSDEGSNQEENDKVGSSSKVEEDVPPAQSLQQQSSHSTKTLDPNRYRLQFLQESNASLKKKRELGRQILHPVSELELELCEDDSEPYINIAKRPPWHYNCSSAELQKTETKYFQEYVEKIFAEHDLNKLSYFELNLETWRQLWRVLEMSDIVLIIVDIRYPMLHFSPALYNHVVNDLGKHAVLILNKVDMVPPELVIAWKEHFLLKYPKLHIACFTSYPKEAITNIIPGKAKKKRNRGGRFAINMGARELLEICESIVQKKVDLSSWRHKIESENEASAFNEKKYKNGVLTIGCTGYPNVGKSSLLNGLKGEKVVSVSKTPGHTKHFQTIFITPTVKLCDCPGLVFPSKCEKALQVLAGIYPISQVREPFSAVRYLCERVNIVNILHLQHPDPPTKEWSPYDICEAFAIKRGMITAKAGRPDIHRSANLILRMGLDGRLCLALRPPGFTQNRDIWKEHQETRGLIEKLSKYRSSVMESSDGSDGEFDSDKDENENETSSDEEDIKMTTKNPFALLCDD
ncbi:Guanine nucleotide-binding protein-like 1,Large subunit GTPase 1 homolog [Mytilus coruscus]|uniref:Guanine nucleotide-binding protein-like 1 n=1 Tax=Mytilus coruscus TaxID=42192 RepID=A0A6J7ZW95_MYTCO|nr:Guanine nucleotide-binding protein-like 1,Large subunit GTPase 1 homolog [Mytilus coruscus]